jgi:hypothetical protein
VLTLAQQTAITDWAREVLATFEHMPADVVAYQVVGLAVERCDMDDAANAVEAGLRDKWGRRLCSRRDKADPDGTPRSSWSLPSGLTVFSVAELRAKAQERAA